MQEYLFFYDGEHSAAWDFVIVEATDEATARALYIRETGIYESLFLESAYGRDIHSSFMQHLFGVYADDTRNLASSDDSTTRLMVERYFKDREFSALYLAFLSDPMEADADILATKWQFPPAMLVQMFLDTEAHDLRVVAINDIERIGGPGRRWRELPQASEARRDRDS